MRILAHHDNFRVQRENTIALPAQYNSPNHAFLAHKDFTNILRNAGEASSASHFIYMTYMPSALSRNFQLDLMAILSLAAAYNLNQEQIKRLKDEISHFDDRNKTIEYILLNTQVMRDVCSPQVSAPAVNTANIEKQIQLGMKGIVAIAKTQKVTPQINAMIMGAYNQPLINRINIEQLPASIQKYFTGADQTYFKGRSYAQLLADLNPQPVARVNPALDGMKAEAQASYATLFSLYIRASEENRSTAERVFGRQAVIFGGNLVPIQPNGFMPAAVGPVVNPNPVNPLLYSINQINGVYEINGIREGQPGFAALVNAAPPSIIGLLPARLRGQNPVPPLNNPLNNWGNLIYPNPVMPPVNPFAPVNPPPLSSILPSNLTTVAIANGDTKVTKANHQAFIRELLTGFDKTTILDNLKDTPGPFQFLISELTQTFEMSDDLTAVMKSLTKKQIQTLFDLTKGGLREDFLSGSVTRESLRQLTDAFFRTLTDGNLSVRNAFPGETLETRKSNFDDIFLSLNLMQTDKRIQRQYRNNRYMTVPTGYGGLRTPNIRETQAIIIYCAIVSAFKNDADEVIVAPNPSPNPNPAPVMPVKRPNPNPSPNPSPPAPPKRNRPGSNPSPLVSPNAGLPGEEMEIPDEVIAGFYAQYEDNPSALLSIDEYVAQESARYRLRMGNQGPQQVNPNQAPFAQSRLGATFQDIVDSDHSYYSDIASDPLALSSSYPHNGEINRLKIHYLNNKNGLVVQMLSHFSTNELKLLFKMNHNLYANDREMRIRKDYKSNQFMEVLYRDNERHTAFYEKMKTQMGYQSDEAVKAALQDLFEALDYEVVVPTNPQDVRVKVLPHYLVMRAALLATSEFNDRRIPNPAPVAGPKVNPKNAPPKGAFVLPPVGEMKKRPIAPQGDAKRPVMPPRPKVNPNPNAAPIAPVAPVANPVPAVSGTLTRENLAAELDKIVSNSVFFPVLGIEGGKINMLDNHSQYAQSINALKSFYAQDEVAMILKHLSIEHFHLFFEVGMYQISNKISSFLQQINNGVEGIPASLKQRMLADEELGISDEDEMRDVIKKALDHVAFNYVQGLPNTIEPHCLDKKILHYLIRVAAVQSVFEED